MGAPVKVPWPATLVLVIEGLRAKRRMRSVAFVVMINAPSPRLLAKPAVLRANLVGSKPEMPVVVLAMLHA